VGFDLCFSPISISLDRDEPGGKSLNCSDRDEPGGIGFSTVPAQNKQLHSCSHGEQECNKTITI
ncbi:MAG: hypothetical protein M3014_14765, partial [Chloroflexota bacterium]|nr:hypothetical protein [Chloroflexota bacterium]